ncbi:hypothetical protein VIBNIENn2_360001 [Vibrio nigripulchritudo ENn2]|nr:hypothetical protein VIBNIBLFn1_170001 [Vibrio nigripulchritudo BLFn1]CCN94331.1 hypothetical protein VIBNIENn2_360001 [Vibrio nigripulchritudo ENn2]
MALFNRMHFVHKYAPPHASNPIRIGGIFAMLVSSLGRVADLWRMTFPLESRCGY